MITITLPPELEQIVTEQAQRRGTTPELLSLGKLLEAFRPVVLSAAENRLDEEMARAYRDMAADEEREAEALAWSEGTLEDVADAAR